MAINDTYDVVIIGMGPAGGSLAIHLAKMGFSVLGVEREVFPRYHIGESLTGIAADSITRLGLSEHVESLNVPSKPGVKVIGNNARSEFFVPVLRDTWQVRRDEFDDLLLKTACKEGAHHLFGTVREVLQEDGRVVGVRVQSRDTEAELEIRCKYVADCSGQSVLLSRLGIAGPRKVDVFGKQIAVFSQFKNAIRDEGDTADSTYIFYSRQFHWAWFIPISEDVTSVGVVIPRHVFKSVGDSPEEVYEWGLRHVNPDLTRRIVDPKRLEPVRAIRNFSYRVEPFAGPGWVCVGDAHRFTDPIFSFGVSLAMTEAEAAAKMISRVIGGESAEALSHEYMEYCNRGQSAVYDLIRYFWTFPSFFAFQTKGKLKDDFIRLFAGDVYGEKPYGALESMRRSLAEVSVNVELTTNGQAIAQRLNENQGALEKVRSAFLEYVGTGMRLSFFLKDEDLDGCVALRELEKRLYGEFGREDLAVVSYPPTLAKSVYGGAATEDLTIPGGRQIFERRAA